MESGQLSTLREGIEAWNRRDYEGSLRNMHEDVIWRTGGQIPDIDTVYEGREGVRRFFEQFIDPWEEISIALEEVVDERPGQLLVVVRFRATGREGIEVDGRFFQIYRYDDQNLVIEFHAFAEDDEAEARREAGLTDG